MHSLKSMLSKVVCTRTYIRVNGTMNAMFEHVKSLRLTIGYLATQLANNSMNKLNHVTVLFYIY